MSFRVRWLAWGCTSWLCVSGCSREAHHDRPPPPKTQPQPVAPPPAPLPSQVDPDQLERERSLTRWNEATNTGDSPALEAVYAERLALYERLVSRGEAIRHKQEYLRQHAGFRQTVREPVWSQSGDSFTVTFTKASETPGAAPKQVEGFLTLRKVGGVYRIVEEGDRTTRARLAAKLDTLRSNWKEQYFSCPECKKNPEMDLSPLAGAPLGPDVVRANAPPPPGAPSDVRYARLVVDRFPMGVDVPLFLQATEPSGNGDGLWVYYSKPGASEAEPDLIHCAVGGFYDDLGGSDLPADPGHQGEPKVTVRESFGKDERGDITFGRVLHGGDGFLNHLACTFSKEYEAYFTPIVLRMGRSMRVASGGWYQRLGRPALPYRPALETGQR